MEFALVRARAESRRRAIRWQVTLLCDAAERSVPAAEDLIEIQAAIAGVNIRGRDP